MEKVEESLVERIAKVIYWQIRVPMGGKGPMWWALDEESKRFIRTQAEAVLRDLRVPTSRMVKAAEGLDEADAETVWVAMVDSEIHEGVSQ
mgnify:CR=1 FL=1